MLRVSQPHIILPDPFSTLNGTLTDDGVFESEYLDIISENIGDRLVVKFFIHEITDLMVAELMMIYDNNNDSVISIKEGDCLNNGIFRGYEKDNGVQVYLSNLDRINPGVSGSGKLLEIELELLAEIEDDYMIGFDLRNSAGDIIEAWSIGGWFAFNSHNSS